MIYGEVDFMENEQDISPEEKPGYVPRPWWQVWGARLLLVLFILVLIVYYASYFRGGA